MHDVTFLWCRQSVEKNGKVTGESYGQDRSIDSLL